jgi:hypothetical protein
LNGSGHTLLIDYNMLNMVVLSLAVEELLVVFHRGQF